jgi:pimeloyl-ACP methyl ester carboxylesterase
VDPARVYVGGLSGGSRAALRLALGYPDLFRGAILNAGSDPIGADLPAPETSLMAEFQTSRIIFATGAHDEINLGKDEETRLSLRQWCVFDTDTETMAFRGHDIMDSGALDRALDALSKPKAVDAAPLASCRSGIAERVSARLDEVRKRLAAGDLRGANHLLEEIDRRFAGAAAPESVELRMQALP